MLWLLKSVLIDKNELNRWKQVLICIPKPILATYNQIQAVEISFNPYNKLGGVNKVQLDQFYVKVLNLCDQNL